MKYILSTLIILLSLASARAQSTRVQATVTVTNCATAGDYVSLNGGASRYFIEAPSNVSTNIQQTNSITQTATNLFVNLGTWPVQGMTLAWVSTNSFVIGGPVNGTLTFTASGTWATITSQTNTLTDMRIVRVPMSADGVRTNVASQLVSDLGVYSTNAFAVGSTTLSNYAALTGNQTLSNKTLVNTVLTNWSSPGTGAESFCAGTNADASGQYSVAIGNSAKSTASSSVALGYGATAAGGIAIGTGAASGSTGIAIYGSSTNQASIAVGVSAGLQGNGQYSTAVGYSANSVGNSASAYGYESAAAGDYACAFGLRASAAGDNATAIGYQSSAAYDNSFAIGGTATASDQMMFGKPTIYGYNMLDFVTGGIYTNATYYGTIGTLTGGTLTNTTLTNVVSLSGTSTALTNGVYWSPALSSPAITNSTTYGSQSVNGNVKWIGSTATTVAGNNTLAVDGKTWVKVSSSGSSAWTLMSMSGGSDGKVVVVYNATGQNMTVAHESGVESTAGNRIVTMTGSDEVTSGNGAATLIYDTGASRWILISINK